jgi:hypothetical protein
VFIYQELSGEARGLGEGRESFIADCQAEFVRGPSVNNLNFLKLYKACLTLSVCFSSQFNVQSGA